MWQPIETAPKDEGKSVLGTYSLDGELWITRVMAYDEADGWYISGRGEPIFPTHWMPLPAPPNK